MMQLIALFVRLRMDTFIRGEKYGKPHQRSRSAIELLKRHEGQYLETSHPVDPDAELAGVYRHIGAGGTVKRPTRIGPAMMFNAIKGYPDSRILVGMHASRERAALLLGCEPSELAKHVGGP